MASDYKEVIDEDKAIAELAMHLRPFCKSQQDAKTLADYIAKGYIPYISIDKDDSEVPF